MFIKTCTLCDNIIPYKAHLCLTCIRIYKQYTHEPWFRELRTAQNKVDWQRAYETSLDAYVQSVGEKRLNGLPTQTKQTHTYYTTTKNIRPEELERIVIELFIQDRERVKLTQKAPMSYQSIAKQVQALHGVVINAMFVHRALKLRRII